MQSFFILLLPAVILCAVVPYAGLLKRLARIEKHLALQPELTEQSPKKQIIILIVAAIISIGTVVYVFSR